MLLEKIFKRDLSVTDPKAWDRGLWNLYGSQSVSGIKVDENTALTMSAVFACIRLLSNTVAQIPLHLYRRVGKGKEKATERPIYSLIHRNPNPSMSSFRLRQTLQGHLGSWGNAYCYISRDRLGRVLELWPLRPDRMRLIARGEYEYYNGKEHIPLTSDEVLHIPGFGFDGIQGYSIISLARQGIGLGMAAEEFGSRYFGSGTHPGLVVKHPGKLSVEAHASLKKDLQDKWSNLGKSHKLLLLEEEMSIEKIGIPPEDSQFLQCVVPGTSIKMADGSMLAVEKLKVGNEIMGWNNGPISAKIKAVGKPPAKPLTKITTVRGRTLIASFDHPCLALRKLRTAGCREFPIIDEWIKIDDLEVGNYVRVGLGSLNNISSVGYEKAYFLGMMVGDGYIKKTGQSSFSNIDPNVITAMKEKVESLGGDIVQSKTRPCDWHIRTNGKGCKGSEITKLLRKADLLGKNSDTKRVPQFIMSGGPAALRGFLSGYLDADGSVRNPDGKQNPAVFWSSVNRDLLVDCQQLLASLNIQSTIYSTFPGGLKKVFGKEIIAKPLWSLYVMGNSQLKRLADELSPKHTIKKERLNKFFYVSKSRYRDVNFQYDRIKKVERWGIGETVGIEVGGVHTHITGGIVTHNTRQFQVQDIARWYGVPPHLIQDETRSTYSNIEQQALNFVIHSATPWLVLWEQELSTYFLKPTERKVYFFEFNVEGLLRGDSAARVAYYSGMWNIGAITHNEIRAKENMNPVKGGDKRYIPLNMVDANEPKPPVVKELPGEFEEELEDEEENTRSWFRKKIKTRDKNLKAATSRKRIADSYYDLIKDAAQNIVNMETKAISRATTKFLGERGQQDFDKWLDDFYKNEVPDQIKKRFLPTYQSFAEQIRDAAAGEVSFDPDDFDTFDKFVNDYLDVYVARHTNSSVGQMRGLMKDAEPEDLSEVINTRVDEWQEKRATKVSQDEVVRFSNAVAKATWVVAGVSYLIWVNTGSKSCPYCVSLNGKIVGINKYFLKDGENFQPSGAGPMNINGSKYHAPAHQGCKCQIGPA